jgi:NAD(P)-dependent dehydrogenase (short-subunit alcohol dehydrogenase family)
MKDYFNYQDKVCVVTGAASGMGKAATEMLVDLGAKVYALDLNSVDIPGIEKSIQVNLAEKESIDRAFDEIPLQIDKFFGVAGLSGIVTDYHLTFTVNFIANKYMTEEYLEHRVVQGGSIAYITSTAGMHWEKYQWEYRKIAEAKTWAEMTSALHKKAPRDGYGPFAYVLSKRAMNYYISARFTDFAKKDIRMNYVLPGSTDTGMKAEFEEITGGEDQLIKQAGVAGRLAESREMAEPLVFINSDMASFITGYGLIVDYGDETLKTLKLKKNLQNMPVGFKVYHTTLFKKLVKKYIEST